MKLIFFIIVIFCDLVKSKLFGNLCIKKEYLDGNWLYNNLTKQSNTYSGSLISPKTNHQDSSVIFSCCPSKVGNKYFENQEMLLPAICPSEKRLNFTDAKGGNNVCCECKYDYSLNSEAEEREKWEWVPSTCHLLHFEAVMFCHILGNRTILLAGDSQTKATYHSLVNMLNAMGGLCGKQIFYGQSHFLHYASHKGSDHTVHHYVVQFNPDIVIVSVGAWLHEEFEIRDETVPMVLKMINSTEKWRAEKNITKPLNYFWRTQYGGHVDCFLHTQPLAVYNSSIRHFSRNFTHDHPTMHAYNWHYFQQYDHDAYHGFNHSVVDILDVSPLYLRADAHTGLKSNNQVDCLHYILPGALDLTPRIMYHMLFMGEM